jgi:flagellar basal body rod protein FlgF
MNQKKKGKEKKGKDLLHLRHKEALNQDLAESQKIAVQEGMIENSNICLHEIKTKDLQEQLQLMGRQSHKGRQKPQGMY